MCPLQAKKPIINGITQKDHKETISSKQLMGKIIKDDFEKKFNNSNQPHEITKIENFEPNSAYTFSDKEIRTAIEETNFSKGLGDDQFDGLTLKNTDFKE